MEKGTEVGMRKVGKDLKNENQRVYIEIRWAPAGTCVKVLARQGLGNWVEAIWT